jgi:hypothetical protein
MSSDNDPLTVSVSVGITSVAADEDADALVPDLESSLNVIAPVTAFAKRVRRVSGPG